MQIESSAIQNFTPLDHTNFASLERLSVSAWTKSQHRSLQGNSTTSFIKFIQGVRRIAGAMGYPETIQA